MSNLSAAAIVVLTRDGLGLAERVAAALPGAEIHGLAKRVEAGAVAVTFDDTLEHLRGLFAAGRPIVGLCAAGILIRAVASLLGDKRAEPPVLALAEDGSAVVPLLGGHRGANALAKEIADALDCPAAQTTAGDLRFGIALDDPPPGWHLANPGDVKAFAAKLLAGARVRLTGDAPWLVDSALPFDESGELEILAGPDRADGSPSRLVYHPAVLALGVGCERGAEPAELIALAEDSLAGAGLATQAVAGVFSLDLKADETAVEALAVHLGVTARFYDAARLEAEAPRLTTPSDLVFREVGCHGVSEGAALAAAGDGGELLLPKRKSVRATCAIARAPEPIDVGETGAPRGRLTVVGLGPGDADWCTPAVTAAVRQADALVGYRLYLDLLGSLADGKERHDYALGDETPRVRRALELAAEGRSVALVCSGDPGIYAMAALVFELLEREARADWGRVAVTVQPGISALQAAAARIGAPLGHDFCTVSLSDLLTPWPVIEGRVTAAAAGDFVVAFYNPVSERRRWQFERAVEILRGQRPGDTPVVLARQLGRAGESVTVKDLAEVSADDADMLTVVLVGSSETRRVARGDGGLWVYTPRGYAAKNQEQPEQSSAGGRS